MAGEDEVAAWLTGIKLETYLPAFLQHGYDASVIPSLDDDDLDALGVTLPGHRKRLLVNAARYVPARAAAPAPAASPSAMPSEPPPARPSAPAEAPPPRPSKKETGGPPTGPPPTPPIPAARPPVATPAMPPVDAANLHERPPPRPAPRGASRTELPPVGPPPGMGPPPALPSRPQSMIVAAAAAAAPMAATPVAAPTVPSPGSAAAPSDSGSAGSPTKQTVDLNIQHEATGILTTVTVTPKTTVKRALETYLKASKRVSRCETDQFQLLEYFETPAIERLLADGERILDAQDCWPNGVDGCRFVVREVPKNEIGTSNAHKRGKMDKRGGSHKSWKGRFFVLSGAGLAYYASEKAVSSKEPLGKWAFDNHLFYSVRHLKKAPRPDLGFCIRPRTKPVWPMNPKETQESFENDCKFMCAPDAQARADWIASLMCLQAQMHPEDVQSEEEEEEEPLPPKPEPEPEFVPIKPKPVMGVGIGGVTRAIKKS